MSLSGGDDWPDFPDVKGSRRKVAFPAALLQRAITKTSFAVCSDETRFLLSGGQIGIKSGEFYLQTTDGHRLANFRAPLKGQGAVKAVLVRAKALRLLGSLGGETVEYTRDKEWLQFQGEKRIVGCRRMRGAFPKADQYWDQDAEVEAEFSAVGLREGIEACLRFAKEPHYTCVLRFEVGGVTLSSTDSDRGIVCVSLPCQHNYDRKQALELGVNGRYLKDIADAAGDRILRMTAGTEEQMTVWRPLGGHARWILMQVRLDEATPCAAWNPTDW